MDIGRALSQYIQRMLASVSSHKVFYLDKETLGIVSQLLSQTQILEQNVFLTHELGVPFRRDANVGHLSAIVFVRPTDKNIDELVKHLENPKHNSYFLFFSNQVEEHALSRLAQADRYEVVQQIQELYADVFPVNPDFWTLRVQNQCAFYKEEKEWRVTDVENWQRQVDAVVACLLAFKKKPIIRYQRSSNLAHKLSHDVQAVIQSEPELFGWSQPLNQPLLLVVDRREDPITPLLMQWTYQAMVHEVLGINNSRVNMRGTVEEKKDDDAVNELIMNPFNDKFFDEQRTATYGDIADRTQRMVQSFARTHQATRNQGFKTIEDMQRFVENYPEFLAERGSVSKHLSIVSTLKDAVNHRQLLAISELEQEMVTENNSKKHLSELESVIQNPRLDDNDKLRLTLLYCLRYESKLKDRLPRLRALLRENCTSLGGREVEVINVLLRNFGSRKRSAALFSDDETGLKRMKNWMKSQVQDVECVFTQHDPLLHRIIEDAVQCKLPLNDFPSMSGASNRSSRPDDIIIFMVGGATYEEALSVTLKNREHPSTNIVLGTGFVHNSQTFLSDIKRNFVSFLDTDDV